MNVRHFIEGLTLQLAIITAFGPQNLMVLQTGLARRQVWQVVLICVGCDLLLLVCSGIFAPALAAPFAWAAPLWGRVAALALFCYGVFSLVRARAFISSSPTFRPCLRDLSGRKACSIIPRTLAVSLLNPHVYFDAFCVIGLRAVSLAPSSRFPFILGAMCASAIWFSALGMGALRLARWGRRESAWAVLEALLGMTLIWTACGLWPRR